MAEETTKPLTEAQLRHLVALNEATFQAQARLNEFVAYLRDEHDAPASEWRIEDISVGFVSTKAE